MPEVSGRKEIRKEVRFDGYTEKIVDALMDTGDFSNVADLIRAAILNLYAKYEAQQVPIRLKSSPRIISRSVAKPEDQIPLTVSKRKKKNTTEELAKDTDNTEVKSEIEE